MTANPYPPTESRALVRINLPATTEPKPNGRPPEFDRAAVCKHIFDQIINGRLLKHILEDMGMPSKSALFDWFEEDLTLDARYKRAKQWRNEQWDDECIDIANDVNRDVIEERDSEGNHLRFVPNKMALKRDEVRIAQYEKHTRHFSKPDPKLPAPAAPAAPAAEPEKPYVPGDYGRERPTLDQMKDALAGWARKDPA